MTVRVYLPTTLDALAEQVPTGAVRSAGEVFTAPDESEDGEYAALRAAADASAAVLAGATGLADGRRRRVVVVAEVDAEPAPGDPVPVGDVVAAHADTADDADPDEELAWYATQEIPHLIAR